ncbi:MAG: hypothetical protein EZS28_004764 [Streblomastix strix]|uniref:Uncharacterized protein n=1 Tax=Streblomastix strix TaxID=222440 RepID=A0A5J4WYX6_9EUKA|nr:MAG: hypothetical protein EZS28_004764 [Streblomastix strix]
MGFPSPIKQMKHYNAEQIIINQTHPKFHPQNSTTRLSVPFHQGDYHNDQNAINGYSLLMQETEIQKALIELEKDALDGDLECNYIEYSNEQNIKNITVEQNTNDQPIQFNQSNVNTILNEDMIRQLEYISAPVASSSSSTLCRTEEEVKRIIKNRIEDIEVIESLRIEVYISLKQDQLKDNDEIKEGNEDQYDLNRTNSSQLQSQRSIIMMDSEQTDQQMNHFSQSSEIDFTRSVPTVAPLSRVLDDVENKIKETRFKMEVSADPKNLLKIEDSIKDDIFALDQIKSRINDQIFKPFHAQRFLFEIPLNSIIHMDIQDPQTFHSLLKKQDNQQSDDELKGMETFISCDVLLIIDYSYNSSILPHFIIDTSYNKDNESNLNQNYTHVYFSIWRHTYSNITGRVINEDYD